MNKPITRRNFLQMVAVAGAAGACWKLGIFPADQKLAVARRSQPIMGTYLNLTVYGYDRDECESAVNLTIEKMVELESILSRHQTNSEVALLNTHGKLDAPSPALSDVLHLSESLNQKTEGAFDVSVLPLIHLHQQHQGENSTIDSTSLSQVRETIGHGNIVTSNSGVSFKKPGMGITLDGIGKGYIVDRGAQVLKDHGFHNVFVDAGGDIMVLGTKKDGAPWRIGVMSPRKDLGAEQTVISVSNKAVATSGDYFQYFTSDKLHHHILDPRTGFSSPELASCTVTAPDVVTADGLATAVMALGAEDGLELLESMEGCEGLIFDKQLKRSHTTNFFA